MALTIFKNHWNSSRSLCSLRKQPFLLVTRPAARSETAPPPPLISGSGWPPPPSRPPYLKVWIRHCIVLVTQWWQHLPPTNEAWVKIPTPTPYMGWVVASSFSCSERFFSGYSCFPLPSKPVFSNYNSIWNARFNEVLGAFHCTKIPVWNLGNFTCPMERYVPNPGHRAFGYCPCKQDTKERYWGQQFCQIERDISVRPTEMTRLAKVDHLQSWSRILLSEQTEMIPSVWCTNRNFRNFGLNGKRPLTTPKSFVSEQITI